MLFTPLLPEVAAGAVEPRHALVPLRMMCPHAELVRGRAAALDEASRTVTVETDVGAVRRVLRAPGDRAGLDRSAAPHPRARRHAITFKGLGDAIHLRNHVSASSTAPRPTPPRDAATSASSSSAQATPAWRPWPRRDSSSRTPSATTPPCDTFRNGGCSSRPAPRSWPRSRDQLADYTPPTCDDLGVESPHVDDPGLGGREGGHPCGRAAARDRDRGVDSRRERQPARPRRSGCRSTSAGGSSSTPSLRVQGRTDIWALGDNARVPNAATPFHRSTHVSARRTTGARTPDASLVAPDAYRYRSIGEGATLGRDTGLARILGFHVRGRLGAWVTRAYHLGVVPLFGRRLRILTDRCSPWCCAATSRSSRSRRSRARARRRHGREPARERSPRDPRGGS